MAASRISRREVLRKGGSALGAGAAALTASASAVPQQAARPAPGPDVAGRRFRAFIRTAQGASVQDVRCPRT